MTLKLLRQESQKSVKDVANFLHITVQSVYRYERGEHKLTLEQVLLLAHLYDCTEKEIIEAQLNSCPCVQ